MKTTALCKALLCTLLCITLIFNGFSQVMLQAPTNARIMGLGGIYSPLSDDRSALGNPAGLAFCRMSAVSASAERRFVLRELQSVSLSAALPFAGLLGGVGLSVESAGFESFSQMRYGLAYGKSLIADKLALGIKMWWLQTYITDYGSAGAPSFDLGLMSKLSEKLTIALYVLSPIRVKLAGEPLDGLLRWGLAYMPSPKVVIFTELEKDIRHPLNGKAGIEYKPLPSLALRCGWNTEPAAINAGLGMLIARQWSIDMAFSYHQWLGFSPVCSITFQQKTQK